MIQPKKHALNVTTMQKNPAGIGVKNILKATPRFHEFPPENNKYVCCFKGNPMKCRIDKIIFCFANCSSKVAD